MLRVITLKLKEEPNLPVEAEIINPDHLADKSIAEIGELKLLYGNQQRKIADFFDITEKEEKQKSQKQNDFNGEITNNTSECSNIKIILQGNLSRFKRLGQGMTSGEMRIEGPVGFHTGAKMRGGLLHIIGEAGDWLGAEMEDGKIIVEGSAGHYLGSAYRGNVQGMRGGMILIYGSAGQMAGSRMRRGIIAIRDDCGDNPGYAMLAGTLLIGGNAGIRIGANMIRGTIILLNQAELLPTFYYNCTCQLAVWGMLYRELQSQGFKLADSYESCLLKRYSGDGNEGAKGEILICG